MFMPPGGEERLASRDVSLGGIQVLRAIAALLVVLYHALEESLASVTMPKSPDWFTTFGAAGVDIFFVISGFNPNRRPAERGPRSLHSCFR
jgi:peptidoglycan/LPS O-acetylase OafA/YrhL